MSYSAHPHQIQTSRLAIADKPRCYVGNLWQKQDCIVLSKV